LFGVVSAWKLHPGWRHHLKSCTNIVAFKSLGVTSLTIQKKTVAGTQKRITDPNTSSLAVTPTDNLSSPKRERKEEGEVAVKTSADDQLALVATGIT